MKFTNKFIYSHLFLFDTFARVIILAHNRDEYAPPERYFEVGAVTSKDDYYIDTFWVNRNTGEVIDFAYTYEDSWNCNPNFTELLYNHFERHGLPRIEYSLKQRLYPRERFRNLLKQYFVEEI